MSPVPNWLRAWAWLTLVAALPLAVLGAETTTKGVGMADQVSLREPWYFFTLNLKETPVGLLIEHAHRLFGWAVGLCAIVLAVGLQLAATGWRRYLGWLALAMVSAQGIFGILRVKWNALAGDELAAFHGCFAQLAFATLVAVAVLLSRTWQTPNAAAHLRKLAIAFVVLVYVQIVFGAIVRHLLHPHAQRLHVLLAFAVVGLAFSLVTRLRASGDPASRLGRVLLVLVLIQPIFGVEAWMRRFAVPGVLPKMVPNDWALDFTRSGHHLLGTAIFLVSVALTVLVCRTARTNEASVSTDQPLGDAA